MSINEHIKARFGLPTNIGETLEGNQTITNILSRRSHRVYTDDTVPKDLLNTLFATAFSAPSKSDLQQVCVINVQDKEKQNRITNTFSDIEWAGKAPVFLVWCGDSSRIRKLGDVRNHPFANDHLDSFMNAAVDVGICMQTFIIAAESFGLGCCPVSEIRDHIDELSAELELPQHVFPVAGLCVGWPEDQPSISLRLPMTTTVKVDTYDDDTLVEDVASYDIRREEIDQTPLKQQLHVDEFGVSPNYGWSEYRTRQYSNPARADFGSYIRKQGFNLS
jgi:nitroreductase